MSMVCKICDHPKRIEIDRELIGGKSRASIGKRFNVPGQSLQNHMERHLSRQLVQAYERKSLTENTDLLARIDNILSRAEKIFIRNYNQKRDLVALKALAEQRNTIDLLARISMYLHESRAMELQLKQSSYQAQREAEEKEFISRALDRLTDAEADLWEKLLAKMNGETDEPVIADFDNEEPMPVFKRKIRLSESAGDQVSADALQQ